MDPVTDAVNTPPTDTQGDDEPTAYGVLLALRSLMDEYWRSCDPAPFTNERALAERVLGLVRSGIDSTVAARPVPAATHTDPAAQALRDAASAARENPAGEEWAAWLDKRAREADRLAAQAPAATTGLGWPCTRFAAPVTCLTADPDTEGACDWCAAQEHQPVWPPYGEDHGPSCSCGYNGPYSDCAAARSWDA